MKPVPPGIFVGEEPAEYSEGKREEQKERDEFSSPFGEVEKALRHGGAPGFDRFVIQKTLEVLPESRDRLIAQLRRLRDGGFDDGLEIPRNPLPSRAPPHPLPAFDARVDFVNALPVAGNPPPGRFVLRRSQGIDVEQLALVDAAPFK